MNSNKGHTTSHIRNNDSKIIDIIMLAISRSGQLRFPGLSLPDSSSK